jgi:hypothetical protein
VPDQDVLLARRRELGPIRRHRGVDVEPAPVDQQQRSQARDRLRDRPDMVIVCSSHGTVRASSRNPPHRSTTRSPSMSTTSEAPSSSPDSMFCWNAARTAAKRGSDVPCSSFMPISLLAFGSQTVIREYGVDQVRTWLGHRGRELIGELFGGFRSARGHAHAHDRW